ncbi:MAG: ABC transporter permease [Flavobacteriaceae bacterium]|nr:ABC transporter permease [Flavobacteriaceae bacterium]
MSSLDKNVDIRKYLPHRDSMLMVDRLIDLKEDFVKTSFLIKKNNIFLKNNLFVESGLIENIAQTCSIIAGSSYFNDGDERLENKSQVIGYISALKSVQINSLPQIGDLLFSHGTMISRFDFDNYLTCTMKGQIICDDKVLLDCLLNLFIKDTQA